MSRSVLNFVVRLWNSRNSRDQIPYPICMDDLHLRYVDRRFVSLKEDYEVKTFEQEVKAQRPHTTSAAIHNALLNCENTVPHNHPRQRILDCVLRHL